MRTKIHVILLCTIVLCACERNSQTGTGGNGVKEPVAIHLSPVQEIMTEDCNDFSFELLQKVYADDQKNENIILSPLSASMALGMLMNGADGNTLKQMSETTGFDKDATIEDINLYFKTLLKALPALDQSNTVHIANSIWAQEGYPFHDTFLQTNREYFSASIQNVDFDDTRTADLINRWASDNTNQLIKKVIEPKDLTNLRMLLANALYFKGVWAVAFDKSQTEPYDFTTASGKAVKTDFMNQTSDYAYYEDDDVRLVELPYKEGKYCMDILLPAKDKDLKKTVDKLDAAVWKEYIRKMKQAEVYLSIPKFSLSCESDLGSVLEQMGMTDAFNPDMADFSLLSGRPLFIGKVKQVCQLNVDEEGTEAAAVTTIGTYEKSSVNPFHRFVADRPFLLVIREKQYGTILFTAVIDSL